MSKIDDQLDALVGVGFLISQLDQELENDLHKTATAQVKKALYKDMLELLGEDEKYEGHQISWIIEHRNDHRQELRTKLKGYFGVEE